MAAPRAGGEPAHSSEGSMPSADAAGALGGRVGWRYWPEGGQRQHHRRARWVVAVYPKFLHGEDVPKKSPSAGAWGW